MFQPCVATVSSAEEEEFSQERASKHQSPTSSNNPQQKITPFDAVLRAVEQLLKLRVKYVATSKAGKRDGVGVVLFGTKKRKDHLGITSTLGLIPMEPPGIPQVLNIRKCLPKGSTIGRGGSQGSNKPRSSLFYFSPVAASAYTANSARINARERDLQQEVADQDHDNEKPSHVAASRGHSGTLSTLRAALLQANEIFLNAKCVKKDSPSYKGPPDTKTIWIFTNQDDPCYGRDDEKNQVEKIIQDVTQNGIEIKVWPLPNASGSVFDRTLFYSRINNEEQIEEELQYALDPSKRSVNLTDFLSQVNQQWKKRRPFRGISMVLPGSMSVESNAIALDLYRLVQPQTKPTPVSVHQQTNK